MACIDWISQRMTFFIRVVLAKSGLFLDQIGRIGVNTGVNGGTQTIFSVGVVSALVVHEELRYDLFLNLSNPLKRLHYVFFSPLSNVKSCRLWVYWWQRLKVFLVWCEVTNESALQKRRKVFRRAKYLYTKRVVSTGVLLPACSCGDFTKCSHDVVWQNTSCCLWYAQVFGARDG